MTAVQTTLLAAAISSPLLFALFEFLRDKILARIKYKGWQAVFLDNKQVYFGKITSVSRNDIRLVDIYYLQGDGKNAGYPTDAKEAGLSLVKLGDELHAPQDIMTIGRTHILFTETLKDSAEVVKAIEHFKLGEKLADVKLAGID